MTWNGAIAARPAAAGGSAAGAVHPVTLEAWQESFRATAGGARSSCPAHRRQPFGLVALTGELALDGDQGQVPAEHVVQVAGEAQPLLGDRQAGVAVRDRSSSDMIRSVHADPRQVSTPMPTMKV